MTSACLWLLKRAVGGGRAQACRFLTVSAYAQLPRKIERLGMVVRSLRERCRAR